MGYAAGKSHMWIIVLFAYVTLWLLVWHCTAATATANASFFTPLAWAMSRWLSGSLLISLLFWSMVHLCVKLYGKSHVKWVQLMQMFGWFCSAVCLPACLLWFTARLQTALDAVPEGRYLAGVTCVTLCFRVASFVHGLGLLEIMLPVL